MVTAWVTLVPVPVESELKNNPKQEPMRKATRYLCCLSGLLRSFDPLSALFDTFDGRVSGLDHFGKFSFYPLYNRLFRFNLGSNTLSSTLSPTSSSPRFFESTGNISFFTYLFDSGLRQLFLPR